MRILIATPLFPPDTAPAAVYAKELAARLSGLHEVSVVAYSYIPEQVPGAQIHAVSKRQPVPIRITAFMAALFQKARHADILFPDSRERRWSLALATQRHTNTRSTVPCTQ